MQVHPFDREAFRVEIRQMDNAHLERLAQDCAYMSTTEANGGEPPAPIFTNMFEEVQAEWLRRNLPPLPPTFVRQRPK
jgi:hypothetical protein